MPRHVCIEFDNFFAKADVNAILDEMKIPLETPKYDRLVGALVENVLVAESFHSAREYVANLGEELEKIGFGEFDKETIEKWKTTLNKKCVFEQQVGFRKEKDLVENLKGIVSNKDKISVISKGKYPAAVEATIAVLLKKHNVKLEEKIHFEHDPSQDAKSKFKQANKFWPESALDSHPVLFCEINSDLAGESAGNLVVKKFNASDVSSVSHFDAEWRGMIPRFNFYKIENNKEILLDDEFLKVAKHKFELGPSDDFHNALNEFLQTEKTYGEGLKDVVFFLRNAEGESSVGPGMEKHPKLSDIIGVEFYKDFLETYEELEEKNKELISFLKGLQEEYKGETKQEKLAECAKKIAEKSKEIIPIFNRGADLYLKLTVEASKDSENRYRKLYADFANIIGRRGNDTSIDALTITPVQRGPRYVMLVGDMDRALSKMPSSITDEAELKLASEATLAKLHELATPKDGSAKSASVINWGVEWSSWLGFKKSELTVKYEGSVAEACKRLNTVVGEAQILMYHSQVKDYLEDNRFFINIESSDTKFQMNGSIVAEFKKVLPDGFNVEYDGGNNVLIRKTNGDKFAKIRTSDQLMQFEFLEEGKKLQEGESMVTELQKFQQISEFLIAKYTEGVDAPAFAEINVKGEYLPRKKSLFSSKSKIANAAKGSAFFPVLIRIPKLHELFEAPDIGMTETLAESYASSHPATTDTGTTTLSSRLSAASSAFEPVGTTRVGYRHAYVDVDFEVFKDPIRIKNHQNLLESYKLELIEKHKDDKELQPVVAGKIETALKILHLAQKEPSHRKNAIELVNSIGHMADSYLALRDLELQRDHLFAKDDRIGLSETSKSTATALDPSQRGVKKQLIGKKGALETHQLRHKIDVNTEFLRSKFSDALDKNKSWEKTDSHVFKQGPQAATVAKELEQFSKRFPTQQQDMKINFQMYKNTGGKDKKYQTATVSDLQYADYTSFAEKSLKHAENVAKKYSDYYVGSHMEGNEKGDLRITIPSEGNREMLTRTYNNKTKRAQINVSGEDDRAIMLTLETSWAFRPVKLNIPVANGKPVATLDQNDLAFARRMIAASLLTCARANDSRKSPVFLDPAYKKLLAEQFPDKAKELEVLINPSNDALKGLMKSLTDKETGRFTLDDVVDNVLKGTPLPSKNGSRAEITPVVRRPGGG